MFESSFAKASKRGLEPAEIGRKALREVTQNLLSGTKYYLAPNQVLVILSERDFENLQPVINSIRQELVLLLSEAAETSSFRFVGPLEVTIEPDALQRFGTVSVEAKFNESVDYVERRTLNFEQGQVVDVGETVVSVGRLPGCSVVIEDPKVSRQHAEVWLQDGEVYIRDLNSTNGTFVNGVKIRQEHRLEDGDLVEIGRTKIVYSVV